jgi:hydroxymethylpyrimidine pyrophosphatase-like HAD family hydrolase
MSGQMNFDDALKLLGRVLIVHDLDGCWQENIHAKEFKGEHDAKPAYVNLLKQIKGDGSQVVLATGRPPSLLLPEPFMDGSLFNLAACSVGCQLLEYSSAGWRLNASYEEFITRDGFNVEAVKMVIEDGYVKSGVEFSFQDPSRLGGPRFSYEAVTFRRKTC